MVRPLLVRREGGGGGVGEGRDDEIQWGGGGGGRISLWVQIVYLSDVMVIG